MEPFQQIFPDSQLPTMTLTLAKKTRSLPKGSYGFIECYCTEPACDCRRVTILVFNEKMKQKAVICFGFDQQGPFAGPYLDGSHPQAPYAADLLEFFVDSMNADPAWLNRLYKQYRAVRKAVDGRPYRGKPLPKPGTLTYRVMPSPDLEAELERSLAKTREPSAAPPAPRRSGRGHAAEQGDLFGGAPPTGAGRGGIGNKGMASFVAKYAKLGTSGAFSRLLAVQDELREYLYDSEGAGDELARLLPAVCQQSPEDDERIEAALRVLFDTLDLLQVDLERRRPGAGLLMEKLQGALARHVFLENEDLDLCAAVSHTLLQTRVEILPVLRDANTRMMQAGAARSDLLDLPGEEIMSGISRSLEAMALDSPFEGVEAMLQLFTLNEPEIQTALIAEMLGDQSPMLREISALMLFHPNPEVRLGVSRTLAGLPGELTTPDTLRRLIVSRNWFPEEIRKQIDQAITNARKARVECAPLVKPPSLTVYASALDGAGAQSFQVIVPQEVGFSSCSILLKQGVGVADGFVVALKGKRELNEFLAMLKQEGSFAESSPDYLDLRICHALADGARQEHAPNHWLVRIAELLGCDRWKAVAIDPVRDLELLREELEDSCPKLLDEREYRDALEESADWHFSEPIFSSWFEDDDTLDREIEASQGDRKSPAAGAAIERIVENVLEKRRAVWLERLVYTTLWLKSARKAPLAWHRMYHVAQAVAKADLPLREVPLMCAIARVSFEAYTERSRSRRRRPGGAR